ncbi:hypothetical protein [Nonomuraea fuscirosea]|uniref:hypothetical protein n=1 Tax=Nonomuraea fuscirosea TaxID=1291556 RepID=UPI0033FE3AE4
MRADRAAIVPANAHEPEPGEFVAPLSGCGCGKSTLLRALAGRERFDGGASHAELRTVLLRALGVIDDDHDPADHDATSRDATAHDTTNHDAADRDVTGNDAADRDGSR